MSNRDKPLLMRDLGDGRRLELWQYIFNWRLQVVQGEYDLLDQW